MNMSLLLPIAVFAVVMVLYIIYARYSGSRELVRSRVDRMASEVGESRGEDGDTSFLEPEESDSIFASILEGFLRLFGTNIEHHRRAMHLPFVQAGIHSPDAVIYYLAVKRLFFPIALALSIALIMMPATGLAKLGYIMGAIILVFLGYFGPDVYIKNRKLKRQEVLQRSFPDTLDLILVCVESGLALDAALSRVCKELSLAHPETTKELNRTRMELTLLNDRAKALHNLAERTDLMAYRSLVSALLQTEKFGTSLAETLRVLSDDYRHTRLMMAETKAGRLPALITIPLMLLMMPAFVMVLMGPAIIEAMKAFRNH